MLLWNCAACAWHNTGTTLRTVGCTGVEAERE
jgi:hypothetical protein